MESWGKRRRLLAVWIDSFKISRHSAMGRKQNTNLKIILDRSLAVLINHDGPKANIMVYCLGFSRCSMISWVVRAHESPLPSY